MGRRLYGHIIQHFIPRSDAHCIDKAIEELIVENHLFLHRNQQLGGNSALPNITQNTIKPLCRCNYIDYLEYAPREPIRLAKQE